MISLAGYVNISKYIKSLYGRLSPKNIAEIEPWDKVHADLIGPYRQYIIKQNPDGPNLP